MTGDKITEVTTLYRERLKEMGYLPERRGESRLGHCLWMLDEVDSFVREGRLEKAFRWLGFIQGALWSQNVYTIDEMRDHNRP